MRERFPPALAFAALGGILLLGVAGTLRDGPLVALLSGAALLGLATLRLVRGAASLRAEAQGRERQMALLHGRVDQQQLAIDSLGDGLDAALLITDGRGQVRYANRTARDLFRAEAPEGKSLMALTLSHEVDRLVSAAASGEAQTAEVGFTYPVERIGVVRAWPSPNEGVFVSVYDITELRRLERIRKDFVANVSHEMRTPMTIIRAMAETLTDDDDPELADRYLKKIIAEVDRLTTISQDLLILSAAESNPVRKGTADLAEVAQNVVAQLGVKAEGRGVALRYTGPAHVPVQANASQLTQVVLNLADNALSYTPHGHVEVRLADEEGYVRLDVEDTGIGIAAEHQERIFERFYRVDKARSRSTGGTGLGLSIVRHIVESHGGTVEVQSNLNEGSTFTVRLPKA